MLYWRLTPKEHSPERWRVPHQAPSRPCGAGQGVETAPSLTRWSMPMTGEGGFYNEQALAQGACDASDNQRPFCGHRETAFGCRSEEHTSELQSPDHLVFRL